MPFAERLSAARATLDAADSANVCSLADAFAGSSAAAPGNAEEVREAVEYFSELFDAVVASAPASLQTPAQTLAAAADRFAADAAAAAYAPSIVPPGRPPAAFTTDEVTAAMDAVATYLTDECGPAPA